MARHLLFPALVLGLFATAANAGRPLVTEDADVLDRGDCELEGYLARQRTDGEPHSRGVAVQVGCGVGHRLQVALAAGRESSGEESTTAWALSGKSALVLRDDRPFGIALAWLLDAQRTSASSTRLETGALALVATQEWGSGWLAHGNLGWSHSRSAAVDTTSWNLAVERTVGRGIDLMAEVYGTDREAAWLGGGVRWTLDERMSVNASWAQQGTTRHTRAWTLGFKWAL